MNLHDDKDLFAAALQRASARVEEGGLGIKQIFLEKDYWICRSLKLLSGCEESDVAVFKGGTSLSKAYGLGNRFSEDIDIAITSNPARTDSQTKKIISRLSKIMSVGLEEIPDHPAAKKYSKYRKEFYRYPVLSDVGLDRAIVPGQLMLEIVAFADPYPAKRLLIKSFLTEYLEKSDRKDIVEKFGMEGFEINVLAKTRTATEKLVSLIRHSLAENYISELKAKIRHFYDLYFLWQDPESRSYFRSLQFKEEFDRLLKSDQERFDEPIGWNKKSWRDSPLVSSFDEVWGELSVSYLKELPELAYQDIPSSEDVAKDFKELIALLVQ